MQRTWMTWLGLGLVAPALALGCRQSRQYSAPSPGGGAFPPPMAGTMAPRSLDHETASPPPAVVQAPARPQPMVLPERSGPVTAQKISRPAEAPQAPLADATRPGYQHAPDYSTLVGELHYNPRQDTWRLRYAPVDEEDPYGGSVTLQGVGRMMQGYKSGQFVRIDGELVDRESRDLSPAYYVRNLDPLTPGQ